MLCVFIIDQFLRSLQHLKNMKINYLQGNKPPYDVLIIEHDFLCKHHNFKLRLPDLNFCTHDYADINE